MTKTLKITVDRVLKSISNRVRQKGLIKIFTLIFFLVFLVVASAITRSFFGSYW